MPDKLNQNNTINAKAAEFLLYIFLPCVISVALSDNLFLFLVRPAQASMFYIIGLGLGDAKDISVKGLEIVRKCDRVYLEAYTSILTCGQQALVGYDF